jgi:replication factor A1
MADEEIQTYIDDILEILADSSDKKVTRDELEKEFKKFLEYGVPVEHAKQTLLKKFGGNYIPTSNERTLLTDILPNQKSIHVLSRIVTINPKNVSIKGEDRKIFYGILGDESGTISFTAWNDFEIEKGDVVEISNAYATEWQGATKINLGDRTKVTKTDESKVPEASMEPKDYKIKDLRSGIGAVEVTVRIIEINQREVEVNGTKKKVFSGTIGDETGKAQFTSWHDFKLKNDDVLKISGGYVKSWKGIPQLTFDEKAIVEKVDSKKIDKKSIPTRKLLIHELVDKYGALDVEVEGTIIQIKDRSGLVLRCPECNRVLQNGECNIHGTVKGVTDLRLKLIVDDGTGAITGIINRELTEKLIGKSIKDLEKLNKESKNENSVFNEINNKLFAHLIKIKGNALGDDFGVSIIAKDAQLADFDLTSESERLIQEMEDL